MEEGAPTVVPNVAGEKLLIPSVLLHMLDTECIVNWLVE
jgi:hypothetical protein